MRFGFIDFVDGDNDGNVGGFGVVDGFLGLRHDAIVRSDDQHHDVGNFCSACTHAGERFVAGSVNENHSTIVDLNFVSANVLGDAASFARGNIFGANGVQQTGLAVVDVAHYGDDRRTRLEIFLGLFLGDFEHHFVFERDDGDDAVERFGELGGSRRIERLVDAGENSLVEKNFEQFLCAHVELFGEFANGNAFGDLDIARSTGLRRRDRHNGTAIACTGTLASWMELALTFHLALIGAGTLALRGAAGIERLARLGARRHFVRRRGGKHAGPAGLARARTRAGRNCAGTLTIRTIWRTAGAPGSRGTRRIRATLPAGSTLLRTHRLIRAHGLPGTWAARTITGRQGTTIACWQRSAISSWQRAAIPSWQRTLGLSAGSRGNASRRPGGSWLTRPLLAGRDGTLRGRSAASCDLGGWT